MAPHTGSLYATASIEQPGIEGGAKVHMPNRVTVHHATPQGERPVVVVEVNTVGVVMVRIAEGVLVEGGAL